MSDWFDELKRDRTYYHGRVGSFEDTRPIAEGITDADVDKLFEEVEHLRQELAAAQETICGMKSLLDETAIIFRNYYHSAIPQSKRDDHLEKMVKALSSTPTCPHKELISAIAFVEPLYVPEGSNDAFCQYCEGEAPDGTHPFPHDEKCKWLQAKALGQKE